MSVTPALRGLWRNSRVALSFLAVMNFTLGVLMASAGTGQGNNDDRTRTPIKHLIVIIGENRTFDHVFATYQPKNGQTVHNLLSEGVINADGSQGPKFSGANQNSHAT